MKKPNKTSYELLDAIERNHILHRDRIADIKQHRIERIVAVVFPTIYGIIVLVSYLLR